MSDKKILIFGATGKQGGAVVQACLLAFGNKDLFGSDSVYAVVRSINSEGAKKLRDQGVGLVKGDMEDSSPNPVLKESIAALKPTHVFLMSNEKMATFSKGSYCKQELATANRVLDFLEACGTVQYVVMSSVAGCQHGEKYSIPNFKVKADIEAALKSRRMNWTVLRLVTLMENFNDKTLGGLTKTSVTGLAGNPSMEMWYVSCRDLGLAVAKCFLTSTLDPCKYYGQTLNLASQKLSGAEICLAYGTVLGEGKKITYTPLMSPCLMRLGVVMPDFVAMHRYLQNVGYPIQESDEAFFKELVPQPCGIEDYFKSLEPKTLLDNPSEKQ